MAITKINRLIPFVHVKLPFIMMNEIMKPEPHPPLQLRSMHGSPPPEQTGALLLPQFTILKMIYSLSKMTHTRECHTLSFASADDVVVKVRPHILGERKGIRE